MIMIEKTNLDNLRARLHKHGQEHLLQFWEDLSKVEQGHLYKDLVDLNYDQVLSYFKACTESMNKEEKLDDVLEPLPDDILGSVANCDAQLIKTYEEEGLRQIADGKVAVLLLAGGQGTRLGVTYPKGMYDVGLPSGRTLYQLQAERILKVQSMAEKFTKKSSRVMWYVMTSEQTQEPTLKFFESHKHFGLDPDNVLFFEQNTLPCLSFDGKIILETKSKIARAPDGNGGLYKALEDNKVLEDMDARGIQYIHIYCVDNILVRMADPAFIGFCLQKGANCGAKVVEKTDPDEPVGVICKMHGRYNVVEYSEISKAVSEKRNENGKLTFNAGGIANHFITIDFLKLVVREKESLLQHHVAKKKIPFCNENGELVKPSKPNGIKMEKFVFDIFQFSDSFVVWEVKREDEFSPLKNADGAPTDTPTTSRHSLLNLHSRWIKLAGGQFQTQTHDESSSEPTVCEVSPLISYAGENLEARVAGKTFQLPLLLNE